MGTFVADWDNDSFMSNNVDQDLLDQGISGRPNRDFTNTDFAAEIGGPILKERAWFFASYRQASHSLVLDGFVDDRNGAEPQDYLNRLQDPALKLTWQVNDNNRLETAAQFGRSWVPYSRGSAFTPLTATQNRDTWSAVGPTLKWTFLVSPTMTFDAAIRRGGYWRRSDAWTDAVRMRDSGQIRGGALESAERPVRWQWDANYSVFTDIGGTSHQVKTGYTGSWGYSTATEIFGYTNQQVYRYRSRRFGDDLFSNPDSVFVYDYPSFVKNGESYDAWFITDRINLKRNLTLSFGFRWDRYSSWLPEQGNPGTGPFATKAIRPARGPEEFPIYNSWSPRLSLVYDVTGQGRIALKTSYGRYAGSGSGPGILPGAGAGSINPVPTGGQKRYCAVGNCSSSVPDEAAWAGEIPYTPDQRALISIRGTERPMFNSLADDLKTPFTDEYTVGVDVGIGRDYSVRFNAVRKIDKRQQKIVNPLLPYEAYTDVVFGIDPGRDNVTGTVDDGMVQIWSVPRNHPNFGTDFKHVVQSIGAEGQDTYTGYEFTFSRRPADRWWAMLSYTSNYRKERANDAQNPNDLLYVNAQQVSEWDSVLKLHGVYALPYGLKISTLLRGQTQDWYDREVRIRNALRSLVTIEPERQIGRLPFVMIWDQRISKTFDINDQHSIETVLDLDNVMNANTVTSIQERHGSRYLQPTSILSPRLLRLGARWRF